MPDETRVVDFATAVADRRRGERIDAGLRELDAFLEWDGARHARQREHEERALRLAVTVDASFPRGLPGPRPATARRRLAAALEKKPPGAPLSARECALLLRAAGADTLDPEEVVAVLAEAVARAAQRAAEQGDVDYDYVREGDRAFGAAFLRVEEASGP